MIDNGLAPPNPANVLTSVPFFEDVEVRDQGCGGQPVPCPSAGSPTAVQVEASFQSLVVSDSSSALVLSGNTENLTGSGQGTIEFAGGFSNGAFMRHESSLLLTGGILQEDSFGVALSDSATLSMSGGFTEWVRVQDAAFAHITGGIVGLSGLSRSASSTALVSGGRVGNGSLGISASESSVLTLLGGLIFSDLIASDDARIRIVGSGFQVNGAPVGFGTISGMNGQLTGTLAGGQSLSSAFFLNGGSIVLVPEPGTALLVVAGLVGLGLRGRAARRG